MNNGRGKLTSRLSRRHNWGQTHYLDQLVEWFKYDYTPAVEADLICDTLRYSGSYFLSECWVPT